jgi:protein gp37
MVETKIEWTATMLPDGTTLPGFTFNAWVGCTKVSAACDHCYAEAWSKRSGQVEWGNHPRRRTSESYWRQPIKWNRLAERDGVRRKVFCCSLADVFDNRASAAWRDDLWRLIWATPSLDWLLLTKRPQNIPKMLPAHTGRPWPYPNVWLGTTVENQKEADKRIRSLLAVPATVRFLSCEPLLGPVSLRRLQPPGVTWLDALTGREHIGLSVTGPGDHVDWVICGGESGPRKRPMDLTWARSLRDQCQAAEVRFFMKQIDKVLPIPADLMIREMPHA